MGLLLLRGSSTFASGASGGGRFVVAGNRSEMPSASATVTDGNNVRQSVISFVSHANATIKNPKVTYCNYFPQANSGEASTGLPPFRLRSAFEYPLGTRYRYYANHLVTTTLNPATDVEFSLDPSLSLNVPPGSTCYIRTWREILNMDGSDYSGGDFTNFVNQYVAPGRNEGSKNGSDNTVDNTLVGTITALGATTQVYGPCLIRGIFS